MRRFPALLPPRIQSTLCLGAILVCLIAAGCDGQHQRPRRSALAPPKDEIAIVNFCSGCHPMPNPTSFTKDRWHHEVEQAINIYRKSQRTDLVIPDFDATLDWFTRLAPNELTFEKHAANETERDAHFDRIQIPITSAEGDATLTAISHAYVISADDESPEFALADMGTGFLYLGKKTTDTGSDTESVSLRIVPIGQVAHPAHIERTDLDGDGRADYLVADLGGFFPDRQERGSLWWFHQPDDKTGSWDRVALKMGLMRISDVRAADFDSDGDLDLVVAEFGMHHQGGIHLLTNVGIDDGIPKFESSVLDARPGAIHLPIIDLNGDGHLDFIALISQHHESVVAFLNQGDATFTTETIFSAGDPAYGSSGIELVDMDQDGDMDVLLSNGDTFDDQIPKPIHTVQWLENQGEFPYQHHHIGQMPGAYRAVSGDIDSDGDIDVAAVALLIGSNVDNHPPGTFDGVVFFEQTDSGDFVRHRLQSNACNMATCNLMDWDNDGDLDIVTFPYSTSLESSDSIIVFRSDR